MCYIDHLLRFSKGIWLVLRKKTKILFVFNNVFVLLEAVYKCVNSCNLSEISNYVLIVTNIGSGWSVRGATRLDQHALNHLHNQNNNIIITAREQKEVINNYRTNLPALAMTMVSIRNGQTQIHIVYYKIYFDIGRQFCQYASTVSWDNTFFTVSEKVDWMST